METYYLKNKQHRTYTMLKGDLQMESKQKLTLAILLSSLLIAFLGIGLIIPVLPTIINEMHISGKVVGYLTAAFAFTQLIFSPIAGKWADQFGRKIMIVLGLFIFGLSEFLFGLGRSIEVLFIARILGGLSGAFIMPAVTAFIADITSLAFRPKALGYMSAAISTGFIIGPGIGGFLAEIGTRVPFYSAGVLGFVAMLIAYLFLQEPERQEENSEVTPELGNKTGLGKIFVPIFFIAFMIILISSFGLAAFESYFSLFVDHKFAFTPKDIAIAITGGAIVGAIAQVVLFNRLTQRLGEINVIRISILFSAVLVFLMTVVNSYWAIMLVTFTVFVGFDLIRPAATSYLSKIAGNEQGFVGGMNSMFTSIANVVGPILGGVLFDIDVNYPYYFAAIILVVGLLMALVWKRPTALR